MRLHDTSRRTKGNTESSGGEKKKRGEAQYRVKSCDRDTTVVDDTHFNRETDGQYCQASKSWIIDPVVLDSEAAWLAG